MGLKEETGVQVVNSFDNSEDLNYVTSFASEFERVKLKALVVRQFKVAGYQLGSSSWPFFNLITIHDQGGISYRRGILK